MATAIAVVVAVVVTVFDFIIIFIIVVVEVVVVRRGVEKETNMDYGCLHYIINDYYHCFL